MELAVSRQPEHVRNIRHRTWGSGTRLVDEVQVPASMYHGGRLLRWAWQHKGRVSAAALLIYLWGRLDSLVLASVLTAVVAAGVLTGRLLWRSRAASGPVSLRDAWLAERRQATLVEKWERACKSARLLSVDDRQPPKLTKVRSANGSMTAVVHAGDYGIPVHAIQEQVDTLRDVVKVEDVVVTKLSPGVAQVVFHLRDPIGRVLPLADLPPAPKGRIAYGVRQDGTAATIHAMQSLLIGGLTRHGKSNIVWALLGDLARQGVPVELYASDPKEGLELQEMEAAMRELRHVAQPGLLTIRRYAADAKATAEMVIAAEEAAKERKQRIRATGARKLAEPTAENPLVIVLLDEVLALAGMLNKGEHSPLGRLLYMGATAGYVVWMNTQAAQLEVMGNLRRFIPQRICVATDAPGNTDAILGQYAESKGARCSEIREPGVGYSNAEGESRPLKFRAALVTDPEVKLIARGQLPARVLTRYLELTDRASEEAGRSQAGRSRETKVYRWARLDWQPGQRPGYIGISYDVLLRESQHDGALREFMQGDVQRTIIATCKTRREALRVEREAIEREQPVYNKQHNSRNPYRQVELPGQRRRRERREKVDA